MKLLRLSPRSLSPRQNWTLTPKPPSCTAPWLLCQLQPHTTQKKVTQTQNSLNQQPQGGTSQRKWGEFWGEVQRSRQVRPGSNEAKVNSQVSGWRMEELKGADIRVCCGQRSRTELTVKVGQWESEKAGKPNNSGHPGDLKS